MTLPAPPDAAGPSRIVIIEDDRLLSDLLARALQQRLNPRELHVFATGATGLAHCLSDPPDLLITDLGLPDLNGRQLIAKLRARWPRLRILVVTGAAVPNLAAELVALGASGMVGKTIRFDEIERAVRQVLAGGVYFSAGADASTASAHRSPSTTTELPPPAILTAREREIARRVASGMISKEIAHELGLSPRTIEKARTQILAKLGLRNLTELIRWCMRHSLI